MDGEINMTYVTLGGYVEVHKFRYLYFLIFFTVYILIICFNSTIVCLIWIHKDNHEPMYILIAALLLNSVFFSTAIHPKLLTDMLLEKQIISYSACLFQFFLYYSLSVSEFLLLSAMAYDRYVSICKPLQYPTIMTKTTVTISLGLAWFVPACQTAVPVILSADMGLCKLTLNGIVCNNLIYTLQCANSRVQSIYGIIALITFALFPLLFILFTYTRILIISYKSCKDVRNKATQTCLPHLLVLISFSCFCAYDIIIVRIRSDFPDFPIITLLAVLYHPLFNPLIYGLKMKEITKHLQRFFCQAQGFF
ncbi:olfactory receptor 13C2-like [Archocentrus centrarchus]|uniref:olfactory receptor 13C2-like n=1 Tax=Archocentrus centrarchus TaxID=63155 RepID=UPI0011E9B535|nr:olfactory receptor 13C2-like [Archocentrus centrarchus]